MEMKRGKKMKNGIYENVLLNSIHGMENDSCINNLVKSLYELYNGFLYIRDGSGIDADTSCEIRISGEAADGVFSPSEASLEFSFIDEMNYAVTQTLTANFLTGNIFIMDDDEGCIYNINDESYKLYE